MVFGSMLLNSIQTLTWEHKAKWCKFLTVLLLKHDALLEHLIRSNTILLLIFYDAVSAGHGVNLFYMIT
jgi:hypothetical protein